MAMTQNPLPGAYRRRCVLVRGFAWRYTHTWALDVYV